MKTLFISLLFLFTVQAQNIWYVDRDATGANTGRSWADAWTNLDSAGNYARLGNGGINWEIIGDGDTIYVSGGTDSTVYTGQWVTNNNEPIDFTSQVVVANAWQTNHNGTVYFIETSTVTSTDIPIFATRYISNVKFYGFTFIDRRTVPAINWNYVCRSQYDSLLVLDHCRIIGQGTGGLFEITDNSDKVTITHSVLENLYNEDIENDQDPINISSGRGGHQILNNLIILRNDKLGSESGGHRDGIQISNYGSNENLEDVIANNIIIDMVAHTGSQTGLIYSYQGYSGGGDRRLRIYNNIIVSKMLDEMNVITVGADNESYVYNSSVRIYNNTIICKGGNTGNKTTPIVVFRQDTILIKNNLIISDTTNTAFSNYDDYHDGVHWFPDSTYDQIDYNLYSQIMGSTGQFYYEGFAKSWATFKTDGYEAHGDTVNWNSVSFSNKYDTIATGYYTTTGRDLGTDLSSEIPAYDILGNPRSGNWDIGALEALDLNAVLLTHSSGSRLYDYEAYMGVDSGDITSVPVEMTTYNNENLLSTVSMEKRWYPEPNGTDWVNWYYDFRGELAGNDIYAKLDTFNVIIFKGGIQTCNMTGYGSASDTLTENLATTIDDKTTIMYKYIWRELVDSMAAHPEAFWVIMTGSASGDENNTPTGAQLAHEFATWAKDTLATGLDAYGTFPENIYVFDYFHFLADAEHYLKDEYESGYSEGQDDHPNATACNDIAPIFVQEVFDAAALYGGYAIPETPVDSLPNAFTFTDITNATRSTVYTSNLVTFTNFDSAYAYASGNEYQINSGSWVTGYTKVFNNDNARVRLTTSGSYSTSTNRTLTVGSSSDTYTVTTEVEPYIPPISSGNISKTSSGLIRKDANGRIIKVTR